MNILRAPRALAAAALLVQAWAPPAAAGTETRQLPIIDGALATQDQLYATVALVDPDTGEAFCTGTLIAPRVVVTAAHCLVVEDEDTGAITERLGPEHVLVVAGLVDVAEATWEEAYAPLTVTAHPDYPNYAPQPPHASGAGRLDDIGVLVLEEAVTQLTPAALPSEAEAIAALTAGVQVIVSGYGKTSVDDEATGLLFVAETSFVHRAEAELVLGGAGEPDTCQGDSGGPAYLAIGDVLALVGTTSRASDDVELPCGEGGIYAFTPSYRQWLATASGGAYEPADLGTPTGPADPATPDGGDPADDDDAFTDEDFDCSAGAAGASWPALLGLLVLARRRRRSI